MSTCLRAGSAARAAQGTLTFDEIFKDNWRSFASYVILFTHARALVVLQRCHEDSQSTDHPSIAFGSLIRVAHWPDSCEEEVKEV
jgi:hypothetical protein